MSALYTSSAERWRTLLDSNSSRILRRGSVALRPLSFRLCTGLIDYHYRLMTRALFPLLLLLLAGCGMTREQVRFILGTPLITPIFHADRWDYVYWREQENGKRESRRVQLYFNDGRLARVEGDAQVPAVSPAAGR